MPIDTKSYLALGKNAALARMQQSANAAELLANHATSRSLPATEGDDEIKKAAGDFEALLLHQMISSMWQSVPKDGNILGSHDEETYQDMFNEALSKNISEGQGIGIKGVIERELRARQTKFEK